GEKAQGRAGMGISLKHSGHFRVRGGSDGFSRASSWFAGRTMRKYTMAAKMRNVRRSLIRLPHMKGPVFIAEKSGAPPAKPISGVMTFLTTELTTAPKA